MSSPVNRYFVIVEGRNSRRSLSPMANAYQASWWSQMWMDKLSARKMFQLLGTGVNLWPLSDI